MSGRIFFYLPADDRISGGMRQSYRQVEILRQLGREAYATHYYDGFRYRGSPSTIPVMDISKVKLDESDAFVLPEVTGGIPRVPGLEQAIRVINVQGAFLLVKGMRADVDILRWFYQDFASFHITNSQLGLDTLRWLFPEKPSRRYFYSFDKPPFLYGGDKKRQFCYMPRKRMTEQVETAAFLRLLGDRVSWQGVKIENMTEEQAAEVMRQSVLFLSYSEKEGMPMPPCEAMSCGCVVVGYHGIGGKEYFGKDFCITVEEENSLQYAQTLAEVMGKPQRELVELGKMASEWVTREYSTAREVASIKSIWDEVMAHKAAAIQLRERVTAIFTVDDGNGLAEFLSVSSGFPDCHRIVMWRGSGLPTVPSDVEVVSYGDLGRFGDGSHIALLTRLDDGNIEDCKKLIELGVPLVVNISGRKGVIEHEKTGFIYENPAWAGFWIRSLLTDRELMESFRKAKP